MKVSVDEFNTLVREDLYRYGNGLGLKAFLRTWRYEPGFRLTYLMRLCRLLRSRTLTRVGAYHLVAILHRLTSVRYGVYVDHTTKIGGGFYLAHPLNIVVNRRCEIGRNCNLSHGVTLGIANRGARRGVPVLGDNVYVGPGAVVFGAIEVGDECAIGANSVITKDIPDGGVMVGVPGKILSMEGSTGYINSVLPTDDVEEPNKKDPR